MILRYILNYKEKIPITLLGGGKMNYIWVTFDDELQLNSFSDFLRQYYFILQEISNFENVKPESQSNLP